MARNATLRTGEDVPANKQRDQLWLPKVAGIEVDFDEVELNGRWARAELGDAIVGEPQISRTIEAASTVTLDISDPERRFLNSTLLMERTHMAVGPLSMELAGVGKASDILTLTFEDAKVAKLRRIKGYMKAYRSNTTRAEFIHMQVREANQKYDAGLRFVSPFEHEEQPVAAPEDDAGLRKQDATTASTKGGGIDSSAHLTVKGAPASAKQIQIAEDSLVVAAGLKAPRQAMVALIMAEINESAISDPAGGDRDSAGPLQVRVGLHPGINPHSIPQIVKQFMIGGYTGDGGGAIALAKAGAQPVEIAGRTLWGAGQTSYPGAPYKKEAQHWVDAFQGGGLPASSGGSVSVTTFKPYFYERREKENAWDNMGRLAEEVQWRRFMLFNALVYMSEVDLYNMRARALLNEDSKGVEAIDFDYTMGKKVAEVTMTCNTKDLALPPGVVVALGDMGPASGRYLVTQVDKGMESPNATVTLKKPIKELPEPPPESVTKTVQVGGKGGPEQGSGSASGLAAVKIKPNTGLGPPYWGGSAQIFRQFLNGFMQKQGCVVGASKEFGHAVGGDHDPNVTSAYATDYPISGSAGTAAARAACEVLGGSTSVIGTYNTFPLTVDGISFRVQLLWHVPDHYDHVHIGIRRA